jgi:two-component system, OmpR family, alkaline phosphatase synthesis response regulator PhoP
MAPKILIVDDEPNIVVPLRFLMEQNGYSVHVATTGEDAVAAVPEFAPDVVLLDIMLSGMDGFEVCQSIRETPEGRAARIIFITAMGRDVDMAKGLALGADGYITKPFSNSEVVDKIRGLINSGK